MRHSLSSLHLRYASHSVYWATIFCFIKLFIFFFAYHSVQSQGLDAKICSWDCGYYESIAHGGYAKELRSGHSNLAFYPLYPWLVNTLFSWTSLSFAIQGVILNFILFFFGIFLFLEWAKELGFKNYYYVPALILTLDRNTIWSHIPYTEALFFFLSMVFVLILRRKVWGEGSVYLASFVGGLASGTRSVGVAFVAAIGFSRLRYFLRKPHLGILCALLGILGLAGFFAYLHFTRGAWNLSLEAMSHWGRKFDPWSIFSSAFFLFKSFYVPTVFLFVAAFWGIVGKIKGLEFSADEKMSCFVMMFLAMASSIPVSLARYLSLVYLAYPVFAYFLLHYKGRVHQIFWIIFYVAEFVMQILMTQKFFRGEVFSWAA